MIYQLKSIIKQSILQLLTHFTYISNCTFITCNKLLHFMINYCTGSYFYAFNCATLMYMVVNKLRDSTMSKYYQHSSPSSATEFIITLFFDTLTFWLCCISWTRAFSEIPQHHLFYLCTQAVTPSVNFCLLKSVRSRPLPTRAVWKWAWWRGMVSSRHVRGMGVVQLPSSCCRCRVGLQQVVDLWPTCQV